MVLDCFPKSSRCCSGRCPIPNPNHVARRGEGVSWHTSTEGEVGGVSDRTQLAVEGSNAKDGEVSDRTDRLLRKGTMHAVCDMC